MATVQLTHFLPFDLAIPNATIVDGTVIANLSSVIDGDINADTLTLTSDAAVGGDLAVTGGSALAAVTATTIAATSVGTSGAVTAGNGLTVTTGAVNLTTATSIRLPAGNPLNQTQLQIVVKDIISANGAVGYVVIPLGMAGTIAQIDAVLDATTATGSLVLTASIGATPVTGGVVTITSGTVAGTAATPATPSAANTVAAGGVVKIVASGAQTVAGTGMVTLSIRRTVQ